MRIEREKMEERQAAGNQKVFIPASAGTTELPLHRA